MNSDKSIAVIKILDLRKKLKEYCHEIISDKELADAFYSTICEVIDVRTDWYEVKMNDLREYN